MSSSYYLACTATPWKIHSGLLCFNSSHIRCLLQLDSMSRVETALIGRLPMWSWYLTWFRIFRIVAARPKEETGGYSAQIDDDQFLLPSTLDDDENQDQFPSPLMEERCWEKFFMKWSFPLSLWCLFFPCFPSRRACLYILTYCGIVGVLPVMDKYFIISYHGVLPGVSGTESWSTSGYISSTVGDLFVLGALWPSFYSLCWVWSLYFIRYCVINS